MVVRTGRSGLTTPNIFLPSIRPFSSFQNRVAPLSMCHAAISRTPVTIIHYVCVLFDSSKSLANFDVFPVLSDEYANPAGYSILESCVFPFHSGRRFWKVTVPQLSQFVDGTSLKTAQWIFFRDGHLHTKILKQWTQTSLCNISRHWGWKVITIIYDDLLDLSKMTCWTWVRRYIESSSLSFSGVTG